MTDIPLDIRIYGTLAITVLLYAVLLRSVHRVLPIEPDYTWLEVVIGVSFCLAAAAYRGRHVPGGWEAYEAGVWLAFLVGGGIMSTWEIGRSIIHLREVRLRGSLSTTALAEKRGVRSEGDD